MFTDFIIGRLKYIVCMKKWIAALFRFKLKEKTWQSFKICNSVNPLIKPIDRYCGSRRNSKLNVEMYSKIFQNNLLLNFNASICRIIMQTSLECVNSCSKLNQFEILEDFKLDIESSPKKLQDIICEVLLKKS